MRKSRDLLPSQGVGLVITSGLHTVLLKTEATSVTAFIFFIKFSGTEVSVARGGRGILTNNPSFKRQR